MPAMPPPIADERAGLKEYVAAQQYAFHALAFGLTDEQARSAPSVSALSIRRADQARHQLPARLDGTRGRRAGTRRD